MSEDRSHEALREAFAATFHQARDGRDCPPSETLWRSARGELEQGEEDRVLLHLGECSACAAAWRMARDLAEEAADARQAPARRWRSSLWVPLAAAAALIVVVISIGLLSLVDEEAPAPVYRAGESDWLKPDLPSGQALPRDRCLLRWSAGPQGTTYQVRVTTETLDLLARGRRLERAEFLVPASALEGLPPGASILWQVTARLGDGRTVDSETFVSRIE